MMGRTQQQNAIDRRRATVVGLLLALLLLGQPLLCIAHCAFFATPPAEPLAVAFGFYCPLGPHHHHSEAPPPPPIPAFWPGALVLAVVLSGFLLPLARLTAPPLPRLATLVWAPPVPPPR